MTTDSARLTRVIKTPRGGRRSRMPAVGLTMTPAGLRCFRWDRCVSEWGRAVGAGAMRGPGGGGIQPAGHDGESLFLVGVSLGAVCSRQA